MYFNVYGRITSICGSDLPKAKSQGFYSYGVWALRHSSNSYLSITIEHTHSECTLAVAYAACCADAAARSS
jgi:hypothetical protein